MVNNPTHPDVGPPWEDPPGGLEDVGRFVAEYAADHDRPRTSQARWKILRQVHRELGVTLSEVTADQLGAWWFGRGTRRADGTGRRQPATRYALKSHLQVFMRWAILGGRRSDDPTVHLPTVRVGRRSPRPADRAEVNRVLAGTKGPARRAIVLASQLGLRCMEIAPLERGDLQRTAEGGWELWLVRKGGHKLRVDVPSGLGDELAQVPPGIPLVPRHDGEHYTEAGVSRLINRTFRRAGSLIRAHTLRHLAATEILAETGGDIRAVAQQLGHRSINTTAGYTRPGRGIVTALEHLAERNKRRDKRPRRGEDPGGAEPGDPAP